MADLFQLTHPTRGATANACLYGNRILFQLTHPTRGATKMGESLDMQNEFQLTHPTRGATQGNDIIKPVEIISTHTPHTGCDNFPNWKPTPQPKFQLTHPTRGATSNMTTA